MKKNVKFINILFSTLFILPSYAYAYGQGDFAASVFLYLLIAVVIFFICREIFCWYWKINLRIELLKEIRDSLKDKKAIAVSKSAQDDSLEIDFENLETIKCPKCGIEMHNKMKKCISCGQHL